MTVAGDFIPDDDQGFDSEPQFPTLFGLQLTPTVIGILAALVGVGAAIYLFFLLVQPKLQQRTELQAQIAEREAQILNPAEQQQRLAEAQARLESAEQLQADVLALFASDESLETLLLDLNARVQSVNAGIEDEDRRAVLSRFDVDEAASGVVTDGSYGESVNNRLERRVYNVELEGSYAQVQSILRNIERLQPLLIVENFTTNLDAAEQALQLNAQGNLVPGAAPSTRLNTSFRLEALLPSDEPIPPPGAEGEAVDPNQPPAQPPAEGQQQPPAGQQPPPAQPPAGQQPGTPAT